MFSSWVSSELAMASNGIATANEQQAMFRRRALKDLTFASESDTGAE